MSKSTTAFVALMLALLLAQGFCAVRKQCALRDDALRAELSYTKLRLQTAQTRIERLESLK